MRRLVFALAEVCFLFGLGVYLLACEIRDWRFWRSVKRVKTFWDGEAWVTVEE